jgi:hypothetical protein
LDFKKQQLAVEIQIAELQSKQAVLTAKGAVNEAKKQVLDKESAVSDATVKRDKARLAVQSAKSPEEKSVAQEELRQATSQLTLATESLKLSRDAIGLAAEKLQAEIDYANQLKEINRLKTQALEIESQSKLGKERADQSRAGFSNQEELATAGKDKIQAIRDEERRKLDSAKGEEAKKIKEETEKQIQAERDRQRREEQIYIPGYRQPLPSQQPNFPRISPQPIPYYPATQSNVEQQILEQLKAINSTQIIQQKQPIVNQNVSVNAQTVDIDKLATKVRNQAYDGVLSAARRVAVI